VSRRMSRRYGVLAVVLAALMVIPPGGLLGAWAATRAEPGEDPAAAVADGDSPTTDPGRRKDILPKDWATSDDRVWTTAGDANGFHLLVADSRTGYTWRTAATLSEPGFDADQWIGNACVTGSSHRAVVVYAPRTFTNNEMLFHGGAFTATVDLDTGAVTKLPLLSTLAYFSPGCGAGETAVISQFRTPAGTARSAGGKLESRLSIVDAQAATVRPVAVLDGQVTSAVPVRDGIVAADGSQLVRIALDGKRTPLVRTTGVPFHVAADGADAVVFMDRTDSTVQIKRANATGGRAARTIATGGLSRVGTVSPRGGRVFITGTPDVLFALPPTVAKVDTSREAQLSTDGRLALRPVTRVDPADPRARVDDPVGPRRVRITATVLATRAQVRFGVTPGVAPSPAADAARAPHPKLAGSGGTGSGASSGGVSIAAVGSPTDPVDADRYCSVPRNDPRTQVYQPTARQVEWAVDQAVVGNLTMTRPTNWKQSGLPEWSPQGMFPRKALVGGGRVPAQVMLGILAQESNLWQASRVALPGVTANPLIGNFYGRLIYDEDESNDWDIDWTKSDCGYGVAQFTDGMRLPAFPRDEHDVALPANQQRAIAVDYATNIAAGVDLLIDKWNETRNAGMMINNGDPARIENWFFAVWAYNSSLHPNLGNGQPWGVGWLNNPINPMYPGDRPSFLEYSYTDAAHPQDWPYPEKVMGWAGHPVESIESPDHLVPGYRAAWWTTIDDRIRVKPPVDQFCDASNECNPDAAAPCARADSMCWYHQSSTWKSDCDLTCGHELHRFDTTYPEQPDGTSYPPSCSLTGLPAGALVIDDVADSVASARPNCGHPWTNAGTFGLTFSGSGGLYPSKIDFHQIGGGFGGHFWFGHTRTAGPVGDRLKVTGAWTLNQQIHGWARVMVHMPDHGAHTQQARYEVELGDGTTKTRTLLQRTYAHRWMPLGVFRFNGTPRVRLSTETYDGVGNDDVAFDAVAFQPLQNKPGDIVVALGDSYSSGEGASVTGGGDYYRETDNNGDNEAIRNACHRSRNAWSRKAVLADVPSSSIGARADSWDPQLDFHLIACSGAQTEQLLPYHTVPAGQARPRNDFNQEGTGQYGELSQLDKGFLDENTTLVTLSIGGNDARFSDVIKECVYAAGLLPCQDAKLPGDDITAGEAVPALIQGQVENSIVTVLQEVRKKAPNARILLMGYPKLMERSGSCVVGIGTDEAPWINDMSGLLNQHMAEAATRATAAGIPTWFSNPISVFTGKAICGDPETIHNIVMDSTPGDPQGLLAPSNQSFHPKNEGTTLYADAMNATLRQMGL
jgi:lysophospholipase L1-like esterase